MFAICLLGGINFAFPDVCLTPIPTPVGPIPIPIPYPNIAIRMMGIPSQVTNLILFMPAHNLLTFVPLTMGDFMGLMMCPLSGMIMGPCRSLLGSFKTLMFGPPATKMLDLGGSNGIMPGAFGVCVISFQFKVIILG